MGGVPYIYMYIMYIYAGEYIYICVRERPLGFI